MNDDKEWRFSNILSKYINRETGTEFGSDGFNKNGYNKEGYDREGYDKNGYNKEGYNREGYNKSGYDKDGYNREGFNVRGIHKETGTRYNKKGYDKDGYDREGYNQSGYDKKGYDREGYNQSGYDKKGYDREGYDIKGVDRTGKTKDERLKITRRANYFGLINKAEKLASGQMTVEEYIAHSKTSMDELIKFAKKQRLSPDVIRKLAKLSNEYNAYNVPFNAKKYLKMTTLIINGREVKPTEQDVDICIDYLKRERRYICNMTVQTTIRQYLRGEIEISQKSIKEEHKDKTELEKLEEEQQQLKGKLEDIKKLENQVTQAKKETISIGD